MTRNFKKRWYLFVPLIIVAFLAFGFLAMNLWNWLMPAIFHLPEITFWQTIGLMALSRLILGCGGPKGKHRHCRTEMHEKWEKMTPEERQQFKEHLHMHRPPWIRRPSQETQE